MNTEVKLKFKHIFEEQKRSILFKSHIFKEDAQPDTGMDEADLALADTERALRFRLRNRETHYLRKIEEALRRIDEDTFGECLACGDDIELRRLEARPTATLCLGCKEDQERREGFVVSERQRKSEESIAFFQRFA